ncbi:putative phosphodiesterase [Natrialba magadii ATCC 43099]|uniref:Phosphodiesterase n=1 Tax=Natrialba magadii (strain ATCC 43099 / DSM 3394 / CCM 3739 / CIP 104546 / IAM 13178 / JCM 8861 / NBRC 102185 / NCIMB 2190 / MS3) TaxID=547559 RepID=D3SR39_NATMM|nr:alkaline phosphatase family protein [Natrialba magadii]ADD06595.1 putative phosphodiesterase [Natrialba magadii ATCC 43099]ELY31944.1 type I phosphodiesterase/nucleotide pyrophosphatase [Natrialba magadii ATCC 43099]
MDDSTDEPGLRLLVVGLDAGCRPILHRLFENGEVPTLQQLFDNSASGPLESQIPPWTASAWPSMYTGKNPGKHGVFDFLSFDGYDWDVVNSTHVRERPVWELLSDHGISSVVVNVPVTHPAREFDGALIPGMTAPEDPDCHPEGILEDVKLACGDYRIYPQSGPEPDRSIEGYERTLELRGKAFRYLCRRIEPGFGFLQFQLTDSVFHERPGDKKAIEAVYREVDRQLEATLEETDPDNILVVSDHGMGPVSGPEFRVNEFLRDQGYLDGQKGGEGMPNWSTAWENDLLEGEDASEHEAGAVERAMNAAARVGITTQRVASALEYVGLKEPIGRRVPNDMIRAASEQVDFPNSMVYMRSKSELGLRINLEGREPNGQVPADDYERVRDEVIDALADVRTPDGEPVFDAVAPREAYFDGPYVEHAPDIVTVPADFDTAVAADLGQAQFGEPMEAWNHKQTGVVATSGEAFDERAGVAGATIFDIAPTICSLFDVPIDAEMDGTTLPVIEESSRTEYPAYEPDPITVTDDRAVEDRLSDLGYL